MTNKRARTYLASPGRGRRADRIGRGAGWRAAPGARFSPAERLSRADAGHSQRRALPNDQGGGGLVARGRSRIHRRIAAGAASRRVAGRCRLAGQAPVRHTGQLVAARYGLWRARPGECSTIFDAGSTKALGSALVPARVLLLEGLLDVLERGQARARAGLFQGGLKFCRRRRLGRWPACHWRSARPNPHER